MAPAQDHVLSKELKIRIPTQYLLRLHSVKVLTGQTISDTVTAALAAWFRAHQDGTPDEAPLVT